MTVKRKTSKLFDHHLLDEIGVPIKNLVTDSRQIKPGDTFLAYAGEKNDGRRFIPQAIAAGANAILWDPQNFPAEGSSIITAMIKRGFDAGA